LGRYPDITSWRMPNERISGEFCTRFRVRHIYV